MPSPGPVLMPLFAPSTQSDPWLTPAPKHLQPLPTRSHTPGLQNLGNTCFLNSALQCLLHTPFASLLIHSGPHANAKPEQARFCAFCALQHLAKLLHRDSPSRVIAPKAFANNARLVCNTFRTGRQEDAHEFVRALLDGMTRAEVLGCDGARAGGGVVSWQREMQADVHKVFGGVLESRVQCRSCRHVSVTTEPFLDLSLEISRVGSVEKALERFTAEEILQGDNRYRCEACRKLVIAAKRFSVRRAPNVLTLHLKRFDRNRKDGRFIHYPDVLDLAPFMIGRPKGMTAKYALTGVLIHHGTSRQYGHYYAYVKGTNKSWCLKDDSTSRTTSAANALKQKAYLLFYTRTDANIAHVTRKPTETKQPSTQPMDIVKPRPLFKVPPLKLTKLQDGEQDEELVLSDESSSEDEYKPSPATHGSEESESEEEEIIKKGPRRKSSQPSEASRQTEASRQKDKSNAAVPPSPGKSTVGQGLAKRISEVRKKAAEVSPARKVLGPMARRMEGKAKQSTAEAAKKATETMKESDVSSSRRFLGAGARADNKASPDGDKNETGRTNSEPSLVQRKILAPIRRLSNNSADRSSEKSPETARRRFLSHLGRKAEPKIGDGMNASGESGDETEPSERNSSADDEEEAPAPTLVREVLISGGSAVRKVMHRVFGVVPSPQSEKKKSSEATTPSSPQQSLKSPTSPCLSPSKSVAESASRESQEGREQRPGSSALFGSEGVDRWDNDETFADGEVRKSFTRSRIVKRRRANDMLDAEYDRGKAKKARVRYHQSKLQSSFGSAVERRKKSELGNQVA